MTWSPDGSRTPDGLSLALAQAVVSAVDAVGGYAGGVYLRTRTPDLLMLAVLAGLPGPLLRPWSRMHVNRPFPVAEAYRSGHPVYLGDAEETMRRFPQLMAGLPFPFGSLCVPVVGGTTPLGVLVVLRYATRGVPVGGADRRRMEELAERLGEDLAALERDGHPVEWEGEPRLLRLPSDTARPLRIGRFEWDVDSGAVTADEEAHAILGHGSTVPAVHTMEAMTAGLLPDDVYGLWALGHRAARSAEPHVRRMRLWGPDSRPLVVELTGRGENGHRVAGLLLDPGAEPVVPEAADRVPRGMLSLDRTGRITYVNRRAEQILEHSRAELAGRILWEALPWLANPAYEDHHRAALFSDAPVYFLARRNPKQWLSVAMFPGRDGVTLTVIRSGRPGHTPESATPAGAGFGSPADRSAVLYRPVALAIALTEAVTARQVSAVVTEELLPAFGGRQLAIYLQHERRLHMAWETGFPLGFLDRFDGVGLDAHIPGVDTLTTGRPLFFESMEQLAEAYPGIPLDTDVGARAFLPLIASGRPVGSCILGFDQPRGFSPEERTALTALAGLIAQALQRAQRYDTEAALARGLQDALLPHRLPVVDQVDTVGRYLSGTQDIEIGGDWYDVVETGSGLALVIGDVQGHGVTAAATMGQLRSAVRAFALTGHEPQEIMSATNQLLIGLDPGQFASCCYVLLDPVTGTVRAVRAGHPQPVLRHADGRTEVLDLAGGVVLGVAPEASYPVTELRLEPGAVLALFTDGLVEKAGTDIDEGIERLRSTLADTGHLPLAETADRVIARAGLDDDRPDDIALLLAARRDPSC
ncbi:SpoIIE family protein phosphatase [Streptomyces sp. NBC_00059]|uniref:SpoIIE family protein phosphatase n=1 Tax=Streptomyces sp. NBC_00059 TaxID=2975635 RepID=UPI00225B6732|nr:SpoIIE family protein phosphatase [Streptomyces sp. NBC_00059]MCX5414620.1 SpoIIE family protein phosphatase [Streptomyces sp. NBC_00059]